MSNNMAFTGVLSAVKHLKTSGDLQFIISVPKQMADEALRRAGGFPDPAKSRWMAIAVLQDEAGNVPATSSNGKTNAVASDDMDGEREPFDNEQREGEV